MKSSEYVSLCRKLIWEQLVEAAINHTDSLSKSNISAFEKNVFYFFTVFLRSQIYKVVADSFWQSLSYVV